MKNFYIQENCTDLVKIQTKIYSDQTSQGYDEINGQEAFLDGAYRGFTDGYMIAIDQLVAYLKESVKINYNIKVSEILSKIQSDKK